MYTIPAKTSSRLLRTLGFSPRRAGYRLLTTAIDLYARNPRQCITKELYPALARRHGYPSYCAVECAIRYSITEAWNHRAAPEWEVLFPHAAKAPSNLTFIAVLAEELE